MGVPWGVLGEALGRSWGSLGVLGEPLGGPWRSLEVLGGSLGVPWGSLGGPARGGWRRKVERNRRSVLNASFLNFSETPPGRSFHFLGGALVFFHADLQDSSNETRVFRSAPGEHFSQRQAPKGPQGDSQDPPKGAKNRCFFPWEAPGLEKVEDSSSETRVQKKPEQRE